MCVCVMYLVQVHQPGSQYSVQCITSSFNYQEGVDHGWKASGFSCDCTALFFPHLLSYTYSVYNTTWKSHEKIIVNGNVAQKKDA